MLVLRCEANQWKVRGEKFLQQNNQCYIKYTSNYFMYLKDVTHHNEQTNSFPTLKTFWIPSKIFLFNGQQVYAPVPLSCV